MEQRGFTKEEFGEWCERNNGSFIENTGGDSYGTEHACNLHWDNESAKEVYISTTPESRGWGITAYRRREWNTVDDEVKLNRKTMVLDKEGIGEDVSRISDSFFPF